MTVFNRSPDRTMGATERIERHRVHHTVFELFSWKLGDNGAAKEKTMTNEHQQEPRERPERTSSAVLSPGR